MITLQIWLNFKTLKKWVESTFWLYWSFVQELHTTLTTMYIREKLWLGNVALWCENWSRKQHTLHNVLHVSRSFLFWKHSNDNNLRLSRIVMLCGLSSNFFKSSCHSYLLLMNVKRGNLIVFPLIFNTEINVMLYWMIKGSVVNCSNKISVVWSIFALILCI